MDEFAQGYLGLTLEDGLYRAVDPFKTALPQVLFSLPLHGDFSSAGIRHLWSLMTLAAALGVTILVFLMARRLHSSGAAALFSVPIRGRCRVRAPGMHQLEEQRFPDEHEFPRQARQARPRLPVEIRVEGSREAKVGKSLAVNDDARTADRIAQIQQASLVARRLQSLGFRERACTARASCASWH